MQSVLKTALPFIGIMVLCGVPMQADPPPPIESIEIKGTHGLYVNGKPFFPVAIGWAGHWHYSLPEAGALGFNTVVTHGLKSNPASFRMDIEDAWANGMYALASLTNLVWQDLELVEKIVMDCRDHPGLLVWELEDEPNHPNNPYRHPPEELKPTYDLIKRLDPGRPVWVNLAVGRLKDHQDYAHVADIQSDDINVVPVRPLTLIGEYSDSVMGSGKVGWMWSQMAPVRPPPNNRAPTPAEARCMTYMALAHGISGLIYYSFHQIGKDWSWWVTDYPAACGIWQDLTAELKGLAPYLVTPPAPGEVQAESLEGSEAEASELHLSLRQTESGYFLIAVNGVKSPIKARFTVPVPEKGFAPQAAVRSENRLVTVTNGVFEDTFAPYEVHLYELPFSVGDGKDRNTIEWPRWQRRPRR